MKDLIRNNVNWGQLVVYTLTGIEFYVDSFYNGVLNQAALKELIPEEREIPEFNYRLCIKISASPARQVYCYFQHGIDVRQLCLELSRHTGKETQVESMGCILATYKEGYPVHAERSIKDFYPYATEEELKDACLDPVVLPLVKYIALFEFGDIKITVQQDDKMYLVRETKYYPENKPGVLTTKSQFFHTPGEARRRMNHLVSEALTK